MSALGTPDAFLEELKSQLFISYGRKLKSGAVKPLSLSSEGQTRAKTWVYDTESERWLLQGWKRLGPVKAWAKDFSGFSQSCRFMFRKKV